MYLLFSKKRQIKNDWPWQCKSNIKQLGKNLLCTKIVSNKQQLTYVLAVIASFSVKAEEGALRPAVNVNANRNGVSKVKGPVFRRLVGVKAGKRAELKAAVEEAEKLKQQAEKWLAWRNNGFDRATNRSTLNDAYSHACSQLHKTKAALKKFKRPAKARQTVKFYCPKAPLTTYRVDANSEVNTLELDMENLAFNKAELQRPGNTGPHPKVKLEVDANSEMTTLMANLELDKAEFQLRSNAGPHRFRI